MIDDSYDLDRYFPSDLRHENVIFRRLDRAVVPGAVTYEGSYDITVGDELTHRVRVRASARAEFESRLRTYCDDFRIWCSFIPDVELNIDARDRSIDTRQLIEDELLLGDTDEITDDGGTCLPQDVVVELLSDDRDDRGLIVFEIDPWVKKGERDHYHGADTVRMIVRCRRCRLRGIPSPQTVKKWPCARKWRNANGTGWKSAPYRTCNVLGLGHRNCYRLRGGWRPV